MKFHSALIHVTDFEAAKTFYCDILGGTLTSEDDIRLVIKLGDIEIDIFKVEQSADTSSYAARAGTALVFQVGSVDETMAALKAKGVNFIHTEPSQNAYYRYAAFADPSGNVMEIAQSL